MELYYDCETFNLGIYSITHKLFSSIHTTYLFSICGVLFEPIFSVLSRWYEEFVLIIFF